MINACAYFLNIHKNECRECFLDFLVFFFFFFSSSSEDDDKLDSEEGQADVEPEDE